MTITGYGQVSLEKQRKGRVNGTIGVRRERGIREKVHDEMGIKKKETNKKKETAGGKSQKMISYFTRISISISLIIPFYF